MLLQTNLHGLSYLFVGQTERDFAPYKIRSRSPGVHKSGLGCFLHGFVIQLDSLHPCGCQRKQRKNSVSGVEQWFLGFLEVFVVGERQALEANLQYSCSADNASALAAS